MVPHFLKSALKCQIRGFQRERCRRSVKVFYRNVINEIRDADEILIMGGGKAKTELEREMQRVKKLSHRIVGVIPVSEMTDNEIIADMKKFFKIPVKRNT
jgi:hypothetical protein